MHFSFGHIKQRILSNQLLKDSFWAVWGNSLGYAFFLLSGIIIARFLGKDLYGEYGLVKTTMFQLAAFSTLGLGYTSTKFIAEYRSKNDAHLLSITKASIRITLYTSTALAIIFLIGAEPLSRFINEPTMVMPFRTLGIIIILRAVGTTQIGLLSGYGDFKSVAINNVISGFFMLVACVPLTYCWSLKGSLLSLLLSQVLILVLNYRSTRKIRRALPSQQSTPFYKKLIVFSIPVTLQEFTFALRYWFGLILITKYASKGEVGLYTAAALWQSIILFIPSFLSNVVLSHLSYLTSDPQKQVKTVNKMLLINILCTVVPLVFVILFADWITVLYGPTFTGLAIVIDVLGFAAIFNCCANVISAEMIAENRIWALSIARCTRDLLMLFIVYLVLSRSTVMAAAYTYSMIEAVCFAVFFLFIYAYYLITIKRRIVS